MGTPVGFISCECLTIDADSLENRQYFVSSVAYVCNLVLLALCRIYLSVPSIKRTRLAKKEWKEKLANVNCSMQLTETGFQYVAGPSPCYGSSKVSSSELAESRRQFTATTWKSNGVP